MKTGEMAAWTKRINEVRAMKDSYLQRERMRNLWNDFLAAYGYGKNIRKSNDPILLRLYKTLDQDYFLYV